jgi:hypothetical protein
MITAAPDKDEAGIVEMDIEKAREKMITPRNHVFNDRIPEEYSQLIS